MTAEKDNKVYVINEAMKDRYQADGFDIRDNDGKIIAYGKGRTVSYDAYAELKRENDALKELLNRQAPPKGQGGRKAGD